MGEKTRGDGDSSPLSCSWCEASIGDPEEKADPYRDESGDPMCWQCYHDNYEFGCCWCDGYDHTDHQHVLLVVDDAEAAGIERGVYRIVSNPYYADGIVEAFLIESSLTRIADVPDGLEVEWYPCGHLCRGCQSKILNAANE